MNLLQKHICFHAGSCLWLNNVTETELFLILLSSTESKEEIGHVNCFGESSFHNFVPLYY